MVHESLTTVRTGVTLMYRFAVPGGLCLALLALVAAPGVRAAAPATVCAYDALFGVSAGPGGFCPIRVDGQVSTTSPKRSKVYKVQGADMTTVIVARTSSGTYTSDGVVSPTMHYVGVYAAPVPTQG
jgi:hypothetical protein